MALEHGGSLQAVRARYPDAPAPWLDLSTGINPVAYPLPPPSPDSLAQLPEPAALARLCAAAAAAYGARDPAAVVAAPGTQALIGVLPPLWPARDVRVLGPTYAEHGAAWRAGGAQVCDSPTLPALEGAEVAVVCNPNNPTGRRIDPAALRHLAARVGLLVVDESFADLEASTLSLVPHLPDAAAIVLRSFGKTYGWAGLRLGFAVTHLTLADRLRAVFGPWPVSGPALAAETALADHDWLAAARLARSADAARLDDVLRRAGLQPIGGTALFRLAATADADGVVDRLGRAAIHVRRFAERPTWLRFGLPADPADWHRLHQALG